MLKIYFLSLIVFFYSGCASSSQNSSVTVKEKIIKLDKLERYANNMGCKMLKSGYMVCPKSMNK